MSTIWFSLRSPRRILGAALLALTTTACAANGGGGNATGGSRANAGGAGGSPSTSDTGGGGGDSAAGSGGENGGGGRGGSAAGAGGRGGDQGGSGGALPPDGGSATGGAGGAPDTGGTRGGSLDAGGQPPPADRGSGVFAYISGYDEPNVHVYRFDSTSGALTETSTAPVGTQASYVAISPSKKALYVTDEIPMATLTAFAIGKEGALGMLDMVSAAGAGTAAIAVSPDSQWLVAANYDSDSIAVFGLDADGKVGAQTDNKTGCPSAHNVLFDPAGKFVLVTCKSEVAGRGGGGGGRGGMGGGGMAKGPPQILQFSLAGGKLTPSTPPSVMFGADPRHLTFDTAVKHVYVVTEATNQLYWFDYDDKTGTISNPQMVSTLDRGGQTGAGGHVAVNGNFLYVSNRNDNSITIFSLDAAGKPKAVGWQRTGAEWVREFAFDPSGKFLVAPNQNSAKVYTFKVDATTGLLTPVGAPLTVKGQPATVRFLQLP